MREIKFRAWNLLTKKMLKWGHIFALPAWEIFPGTPEQRPYQIMQYTGLKDKRGKEIYEGDVIRGNLIKYSPLLTMGKIVFDEVWASFASKNEAGNTLIREIDQIEVIGNIYEDEGLLNDNN